RDREIPYGQYLSLATLVTLLCWKQIWPPIEERVLALGPFLPIAGVLMLAALAGLLFVSRTVQRLFGIEPQPEEPLMEWGSGDQLAYVAGECTDDRQGQWPTATWPGTSSGRGMAQHDAWRNPRHASPNAWHENWQRRG